MEISQITQLLLICIMERWTCLTLLGNRHRNKIINKTLDPENLR